MRTPSAFPIGSLGVMPSSRHIGAAVLDPVRELMESFTGLERGLVAVLAAPEPKQPFSCAAHFEDAIQSVGLEVGRRCNGSSYEIDHSPPRCSSPASATVRLTGCR
jgi:hypothetical protein